MDAGYLIANGQEVLSYVGKWNVNDRPEDVAAHIREVLGLTHRWAAACKTWQEALRMLIDRMEERGVLVVINGIVGNNTHRKLDVEEFRGFVLVDDYVPLVFVNGADGKAAQMFTLAHVWLGASAVFDLRELQPANHEIERVCNRIAAEFLLPGRDIGESWKVIKDDPDRISQVARQFKVSEMVAARRLLDVGFISRRDFFEFYRNRLQVAGTFMPPKHFVLGVGLLKLSYGLHWKANCFIGMRIA